MFTKYKEVTMAPFGIPHRKKEETEVKTAEPTQKTVLEKLCGNDRELFNALSRTIMLNPEATVKEGMESYNEKAHEHEKAGNNMRARIAYQVAGEIALYEGKISEVQKFFKKAAEADPNYVQVKVFEYLAKKGNTERAIAVSHQFYAEAGKLKETKEGSVA
jgi:poly-D-alanine transfer protein DltD